MQNNQLDISLDLIEDTSYFDIISTASNLIYSIFWVYN